MMKNKKRVFLIISVLLFFVGNQYYVFGKDGDVQKAKNDLIGLKTKVKNFTEANESSQEKEAKATKILKDIDQQLSALGKLNDNTIEAGKGKSDFTKINDAILRLRNETNDWTRSNNLGANNISNAQVNTNVENQNTAKNVQTSNDTKRASNKNNAEEANSIWDLVKWALIGFAGLLILGGIIAGVFLLRRNIIGEREATARQFSNLSNKQAELNKKVSDLSEVTKNLSQQFAQSKAEIGVLKLANVHNASYQQLSAMPVVNSYQAPREEPAFPVAVDDFLAKSKSGMIPVKYDYKERMLVDDESNEGGLFVVRDESDRQLYLVPSFGFFQTKADYTNYFERYYACARPGGGSVWLRQPATVRQIIGGWELASQGELEVR